MSSRGTNIIRSYDRVGWLVIFFHSLSLFLFPLIGLRAHEELGHLLPSTMWLMPYFAKVCHITRIDVKSKRFWHRSRDVRELAPLCTQTHMYKQINQTNYTSLSLSQTSVFYCLSPLSLPRSVFSLRELIWHRSKVGDPDWGTR